MTRITAAEARALKIPSEKTIDKIYEHILFVSPLTNNTTYILNISETDYITNKLTKDGFTVKVTRFNDRKFWKIILEISW